MTYSEEDLLALAIKLISEWNDYALPAKVIEFEAAKAVEEFKKEDEYNNSDFSEFEDHWDGTQWIRRLKY